MSDTKNLDANLEVLHLTENDILLVKIDTDSYCPKELQEIAKFFKEHVKDHDVIFVSKDVDVSTKNKESCIAELQAIIDRLRGDGH